MDEVAKKCEDKFLEPSSVEKLAALDSVSMELTKAILELSSPSIDAD